MAVIHDQSDRSGAIVAVPVQRPTTTAPPAPAGGVEHDPQPGDLRDLRDRLTRASLRPAGQPAGADRRFRRRWWNGAAWVPSLVVTSTRGRVRLVECGGRTIAVPASRWRARAALRRIRRPARVGTGVLLLAGRAAAQAGPDAHPRVRVVALPDHRAPLATGERLAVLPGQPRPVLRAREIVAIEAHGDARRCTSSGCAALVPVPPPGRLAPGPTRCPSCGRA